MELITFAANMIGRKKKIIYEDSFPNYEKLNKT